MPSCGVYLFVEDVILATGDSVRSGYYILSCAGTDRVIAIRIDLQIFGYRLQISKRHIHTYNRHHSALRVMHRTGTAHHHRLRS